MRLIPHADAEVRVYPDAAALRRAAAETFVQAAVPAVIERGRCTVALAGGATPKGFYSLLADAGAPGAGEIPWHYVHFFFSDERAVPPEHPESNFRMAFETLLGRVPVPRGNIHRVPAERPARAAAEIYEAELRRFFGVTPDQTPRFDLVLLGLGADGHTASLFPGAETLEERERLVCASRVPQVGSERVTFTLPLLNAAAEVVFVVSGPDKARAVRETLFGTGPAEPWPARRVRPASGRLVWLLDEAAAGS